MAESCVGRAVAFPGQGIAGPELADALGRHADHPLVQRLVDRFGLDRFTDIDVTDTRIAQPAVYACGLAACSSVDVDDVVTAFGHSLGEITAMAFLGAIEPHEGFDLVVARGAVCHAAQLAHSGRMVAVMGIDETAVEWLRRNVVARTSGALDIAARNGRSQTVLSGDLESVDVARKMVADLGGLATPLPIGGAFHSPLMASAVEPFRRVVEELELRAPRRPLLSCFDCRPHEEPEEMRCALWRALVLPVRWFETLDAASDLGVASVVDAGPGHTLERLARRGGPIPFLAAAT